MKIEEITEKRARFGGADGIAINRHHIRIYLCDSIEFFLNRTMDSIPPHYSLFFFKGAGAATTLPVAGQDYWGDSLKWEDAEELAKKAISSFVEGR